MLRFVIRRRELDRGTELRTETLETIDAACPELERVLRGGGLDRHGAYDHREVAGVEVLSDALYTEQQVTDACIAAEIPDGKCESLLLALKA